MEDKRPEEQQTPAPQKKDLIVKMLKLLTEEFNCNH